jgi:hypothetical protein
MLIARFGATWASAIEIPTIESTDEWLTNSLPTVIQAGGAGGVFDFAGDRPYPLQPVTVSKSFVISNADGSMIGEYVNYYKYFMAMGRSKLWGMTRSNEHRWAWAKCIEVNAPERLRQYLSYPFSAKFYLPEGVWYGENLQTITRTTSGGFNVPNGLWFAYPTLTINVLSGSMTSFILRDSASLWTLGYSHAVTAAQSVVVNSASFSCTQTGTTNAYQYLVIPVGQFPWMWIKPSLHSLVLTVSGSCTFSAALTYYETNL